MNAASIVSVITAYGVVFLYLLALYVEKGGLPFRRTRRGFRRLPAWEKTFLALFVGAWIAFASVKEGTNGVSQVEGDTNTVTQTEGNTNDWANVEGTNIVGQTDGEGTNGTGSVPGPLMMGFFGRPNPAPGTTPAITDEDIARKWRISSTTDVGCLVAPTANAVTNAAWRDYGGMSDVRRIKPGGWRFPYGDKATDGLTVFQNGDFRPNVKAHFFPRPFDVNLSLLPRLNWRLLPDGGMSVFWHEHTSSNSLILTWRNALYNRDASCPTNFQAELFADGCFDYRYPDRTVRYAPVFPFDWDGDGLENSVDPDPQTANPIDAHGANDEWLRIVCSNVFESVGGAASFHGDVNTNAYYFVDVCAENGPAPIYFNSDRDSRLGSPVIVANGGMTNHVPLLIGVEYVVTSTVPISVAFNDTGFAQVTQADERSYAVKWPLDAVFTEGYSGSNRTYTISFEPFDPGGTFTWDDAPSPVPRPMLLGVAGSPACGCVTCSGNTVTFGCSQNCTCNGNCQATGGYCYESAMFAITGGVCRCGFDDPDTSPPETPGEDVVTPSFSISFSHPGVIFEGPYEDSPGQWKPKKSTRTLLVISVRGGQNGGAFSISSQHIDLLSTLSGDPVSLPSGGNIAAGQSFYWSCVCEGSQHGGNVEVSGTFTENETGEIINSRYEASVVKIELMSRNLAPDNRCPNRHSYGVNEKVYCLYEPVDAAIGWEARQGSISNAFPYTYYVCPIRAGSNGLQVNVGSVSYSPSINVIEPDGIVCVDSDYLGNDAMEGHGMWLDVRVSPFSVSFSELCIKEVEAPLNAGSPEWGIHTGYFSDESYSIRWYHYAQWGAGNWIDVWGDNICGEGDVSHMFLWDKPWSSGRMTWVIPIAWKRKGTNSLMEDGRFPTLYESVWTMSERLLVKKKHQIELSISESGQIIFNGVSLGHE